MRNRWPPAVICTAAGLALVASEPAPAPLAGDSIVVQLNAGNFQQHIDVNAQTLVLFFAPWCEYCKKLAPEYESAALQLKQRGVNVSLTKVDATTEKTLTSRYDVKGFPTMVWFDEGKDSEYDGARTSDGVVYWVVSMTGPPVKEDLNPPPPEGDKPRIVFDGPELRPGFVEAAKLNRRKAAWYFTKSNAWGNTVALSHKGEEPIVIDRGCGDKDSVLQFLNDNLMPMFGVMDGDSFNKYIELGRGMVWSLFKGEPGGFEETQAKWRPAMMQVAKKYKGRYYITITDTDIQKYREAVDSMLTITEFPAIVVQKRAGDKKKYVYTGEMTAYNIINFIADVEAGRAQPKLKSEEVPAKQDDVVLQVVGSQIPTVVFNPKKDFFLEVYAPWCGHCKKLDPEYRKMAKQLQKEELLDLVEMGKIDGVANDSPVDALNWETFPTIYFVKAGSKEPVLYQGERTAKGLWKHLKRHSTYASEIRERVEKNKNKQQRGGEL